MGGDRVRVYMGGGDVGDVSFDGGGGKRVEREWYLKCGVELKAPHGPWKGRQVYLVKKDGHPVGFLVVLN